MKKKTITAEEFDRLFDEGHDIWEYLDHDSARRPGRDPKRVNVDFPQWMVYWLDFEAERLSITRQSLIKTYINDRIELEKSKRAKKR